MKSTREDENIRLDPDKLRSWRQRRGWSQKELAEAAKLSEEYVSKLERAATTANKGTKLQTIFRFASALGVPPEELVEGENEERYIWAYGVKLTLNQLGELARTTTLTQQEGETSYAHGVRIGSGAGGIYGHEALPQRTPDDWLLEASEQGLLGHWMRAEYCALRAREFSARGSIEWADITLRHCALWREQAGDCVGARIYVDEVMKHYLRVEPSPSPVVVALLYNRRAWLALEHYGHIREAWDSLSRSLHILHENGIDDRGLEQNGFSFRVRTLYELATVQGNATLSARQMTPLADNLVRQLVKSLAKDWETAHRLDPDNPHVHLQRLRVANYVAPGEAQQARSQLMYLAKTPGFGHHWDLELGRLHFSNQDWEATIIAADRALEGYAEAAYPPGIALAATLRASATLHKGSWSEMTLSTCLDYWMLALVLQHYPSHPVWRIAHHGMQVTMRQLQEMKPSALSTYLDSLDMRLRRGEGIFQRLAHVCPEALAVIPTLHIVPMRDEARS